MHYGRTYSLAPSLRRLTVFQRLLDLVGSYITPGGQDVFETLGVAGKTTARLLEPVL